LIFALSRALQIQRKWLLRAGTLEILQLPYPHHHVFIREKLPEVIRRAVPGLDMPDEKDF
jgi:hypothetical protein